MRKLFTSHTCARPKRCARLPHTGYRYIRAVYIRNVYPHVIFQPSYNLFAHAQDIPKLSKISRFTYSLSVRKRYPERYTNLLVVYSLTIWHSDVRACTQGVYSCFVKRLLRDHGQQHRQSSDSAIIRCGHITLVG